MTARGEPVCWRILSDPPATGAWNMAVDVALARSQESETRRGGRLEGVLRIYRWSKPTLSFGRNQPARDRYDPDAAEWLGVDVVRRPTGGREVMHDREMTYSVIAPLRELGGLRRAYYTLNEGLLAALTSLGVEASLASRGTRPTRLGSGPCFGSPVEGEIVAGGRKLVGSAQARFGSTLLQHGSLLLEPSSADLGALQVVESERKVEACEDRETGGPEDGYAPIRQSACGGVTLSELLSERVGFTAVAAAVEAGMAGALGGKWCRSAVTDAEHVVAAGLLPHYESGAWTWRR